MRNPFKRSRFTRDVATVASGTMLAQAIPILLSPILSRIYDPHDYGVLGIYMSLTTAVGPLATFQLQNAVIVARSERESRSLVVVCVGCVAAITLLVGLPINFFADTISGWMHSPQASFWVRFAPASIFLSGITATFGAWATRSAAYRVVARSRVAAAIVTVSISLPAGFFVDGPMGLFAGLIVGQVIAMVVLVASSPRVREVASPGFRLGELRAAAREYRGFIYFSTGSEFISSFINQAPIYLLSGLIGPSSVGLFSRARQILGLPLTHVSSAVGEVFKQRASEDFRTTGSAASIYRKTFVSLSALSLPCFLLLALLGPSVFAFVFGEVWREAGQYARILAIMFLFKFVASPLSYMYQVANRLGEDFIAHLWVAVSVPIVMVAGYRLHGTARAMLWAFALNYVPIYIFYLIRSYQLSRRAQVPSGEDEAP